LTGGLLGFTGGAGVVPSASPDAPATSGPAIVSTFAYVLPLTGGLLGFTGGLGIVAPASSVPPDTTDPPIVPIGSVTTSGAGAIFAYWQSRGDLTSEISGNLWTGQAPGSVTAMPYAVLTQVSDVLLTRTTGPKLFLGAYQISVMADDLTEADSLCRAVSAAYDEATLDLDGFVSCLAGDIRWTLGLGLGLSGDDCWMCYVELDIMYTR
jgi:hypothetical protein